MAWHSPSIPEEKVLYHFYKCWKKAKLQKNNYLIDEPEVKVRQGGLDTLPAWMRCYDCMTQEMNCFVKG